MSNFLENDALPLVLVATIGLFLVYQVVRWIRVSLRDRVASDEHGTDSGT